MACIMKAATQLTLTGSPDSLRSKTRVRIRCRALDQSARLRTFLPVQINFLLLTPSIDIGRRRLETAIGRPMNASRSSRVTTSSIEFRISCTRVRKFGTLQESKELICLPNARTFLWQRASFREAIEAPECVLCTCKRMALLAMPTRRLPRSRCVHRENGSLRDIPNIWTEERFSP